jgi:hypothetical protein
VGEEHAKWSPVATAWYRFMPEVALLREVRGALAEELAEELPGLVRVRGSGAQAVAVVTEPKSHGKLLEKVGARQGRAIPCGLPGQGAPRRGS